MERKKVAEIFGVDACKVSGMVGRYDDEETVEKEDREKDKIRIIHL